MKMKWIVRALLAIILTSPAWPAPLFGNSDYAALGFKSQKRENRVAPTLWEKRTFGLLEKSRVMLKSRFASVLGKTSYYRFVVEEETYPDAAAAGLRLDSLFVPPPKMLPDEGKAFPLRKAFLAGNRVVIVRTDVAAYQPMLTPLAGALQTLAGLPDSAGRKSMADSLGAALKRVSSSEAGIPR
jgi:hypothetical protein